MIIKQYMLRNCDNTMADAVDDIMALFGVTKDMNLSAEEKQVPIGVVVVSNKIFMQAPKVHVCTEFVYRDENDKMCCRSEKNNGNIKDETVESVIKRLTKLNILAAMSKITGYDPGPWGILRGVRPTKIVHRLIDKGLSADDIIGLLISEFAVKLSKAKLITDVALQQRPFLVDNKRSKNVSVYIGIPFCPSKCLYCSFPAYAVPNDNMINGFLLALKKDIKAAYNLIKKYNLTVQNVYIGGGTPTSLNDEQFRWLLHIVGKYFITENTVEYTVEAGRPDSITIDKIQAMRDFAVSRVSVNPQTMQQKTLDLIGRKHTVEDIINIFGKIRQSKIPVINMDVIVGLPGETGRDIADTMDKIAALDPDNLTVHTLAVKKGSILKNEVIGNFNIPLVQSDSVQAMLNIVHDYALKMDMHPYYLYRQKYMMGNLENVGYAKPGAECNYNIQIIGERQTIIGIGPAAGTKAVNASNWTLTSCYNAKDLLSYINNINNYINKRAKILTDLFSKDEEE